MYPKYQFTFEIEFYYNFKILVFIFFLHYDILKKKWTVSSVGRATDS